MSEYDKNGNTPLLFKSQSPMLDNLQMSGNMFRQSPLTLNMISHLANLNSPGFDVLGEDPNKKQEEGQRKDFKLTPQMFSPLIESPNPLQLLTTGLNIGNLGSQLGQTNNRCDPHNYCYSKNVMLTASKFAQSPFRTPALNKNSSLVIPKGLQRSESISSAAKNSNTGKEEVMKSETSSQTRLLNEFKNRKIVNKDEKIPLPSVFGDGVIYVSSKRYKRILIRRKKRKAEKRLVPKAKPKTKREPMHESRSKLAKRRMRDENGRYIPIKTDEEKKNKVKCTRGRKSRKYYELMERFEKEGNTEMIEKLKIHGTKGLDLSKYS